MSANLTSDIRPMITHKPTPGSIERLQPPERAVLVSVHAAVLTTIIVIREVIAKDPDGVQALLVAMWDDAERAFASNEPMLCSLGAIKFLHEYFHHHGDWAAMERCTREIGECIETQPQEVSRMLDTSVPLFRRVYAHRWRRAR